jgi:hypothetical protein
MHSPEGVVRAPMKPCIATSSAIYETSFSDYAIQTRLAVTEGSYERLRPVASDALIRSASTAG